MAANRPSPSASAEKYHRQYSRTSRPDVAGDQQGHEPAQRVGAEGQFHVQRRDPADRLGWAVAPAHGGGLRQRPRRTRRPAAARAQGTPGLPRRAPAAARGTRQPESGTRSAARQAAPVFEYAGRSEWIVGGLREAYQTCFDLFVYDRLQFGSRGRCRDGAGARPSGRSTGVYGEVARCAHRITSSG